MVKELKEEVEKVKKFIKKVENDPWSPIYRTLCEAMSFYYTYTNQYEEAVKLERQILEINKALIGEAAVETITSYKRTGFLEFKLGDINGYFKLIKYANTLPSSSEKEIVLFKANELK